MVRAQISPVVVFCCDPQSLVPNSGASSHAAPKSRALSAVVERCWRACARHGVAATWTLPADGPQGLAELARDNPSQEFALRVDEPLAAPRGAAGASARRLEVGRRLAAAAARWRAAGLNPQAVVLRAAGWDLDADLLSLAGLRVARVAEGPAKAVCQRLGADGVRVADTLRAPVAAGWSWPRGGWFRRAPDPTVREFARQCRSQRLVVAAIDLPAVARAGARAIRGLETLLALAARERDAGRLRIATLADLAAWSVQEKPAASHSILRSA